MRLSGISGHGADGKPYKVAMSVHCHNSVPQQPTTNQPRTFAMTSMPCKLSGLLSLIRPVYVSQRREVGDRSWEIAYLFYQQKDKPVNLFQVVSDDMDARADLNEVILIK